MTEVLDAEMKDECHIMLLVRRDWGDGSDYLSGIRILAEYEQQPVHLTQKNIEMQRPTYSRSNA